jgi:hypothetical protein
VKPETVVSHRAGKVIMHTYAHSMYNMLSDIFPEYNWVPLKFAHTPRGYWDLDASGKQFLDTVAKVLNIQRTEDWLRVKSRYARLIILQIVDDHVASSILSLTSQAI